MKIKLLNVLYMVVIIVSTIKRQLAFCICRGLAMGYLGTGENMRAAAECLGVRHIS